MKYIKDDKLSLLFKTLGWKGKDRLSVAVLAGFSLEDRPNLLDETEMWGRAAGALAEWPVIDMCMPKPQGEVLVFGKCFAPPGEEVKGLTAAFSVGRLTKHLEVFGDRFWKCKAGKPLGIERREFTEMSITWKNAFGGPDYALNPEGKGMVPFLSEKGEERLPLPNIENPGELVTSPGDRPEPAGFGPLGLDWTYRLKNLGTFDDDWFCDRWPGFPDDFDFSYFNMAPKDQRLVDYFQGDEIIVCRGMHPEKHEIVSRMPGLRPRLFVHKENGDFYEIITNPDTLCLMPHLDMGIAIWHGAIRVDDDEAEDVLHLVAFYEFQDEAPKSLEFYKEKLTAPEEEPWEVDVPEEPEPVEAEPEPEPEPEPIEVPQVENAEAMQALAAIKANNEKIEARLQKYAQIVGVNPAELEPPKIDPSSLQQMAKLNPADQLAKLKGQNAAGELVMDHLLKNFGISEETVNASLTTVPSLPPAQNAGEFVLMYKALGVKDPEMLSHLEGLYKENEALVSRLKTLEDSLPEAPSGEPAAEPPPPEESMEEAPPTAWTRELVLAAYEKGHRFAGENLAGLDLSDCGFPGIDLTGAMLMGTDFSGSDLTGARLEEAVLEKATLTSTRMDEVKAARAHFNEADLTGASLTNSDLSESNLEQANMGQSVLKHANLQGASLAAADLTEAVLTSANLSSAMGPEARLSRADLVQAQLDRANFIGADFTEAKLSRANLSESDFIGSILVKADCNEVVAENADFSQADMTGAVFTGAKVARTNMTGATLAEADLSGCMGRDLDLSKVNGEAINLEKTDLPRLRADGGASMKNARFHHANLEGACLEEVDLSGADLSGAVINKAQISRCQCIGANLSAARAGEADLSRSDFSGADMRIINLIEGSLRKSKLVNTDFQGANLYGVDLYKSVLGRTNMKDANIDNTLITIFGKKK